MSLSTPHGARSRSRAGWSAIVLSLAALFAWVSAAGPLGSSASASGSPEPGAHSSAADDSAADDDGTPKGGTLRVALTSPAGYVPDTPPGGGNFEPYGTIGFALYEGLYCVDFKNGEEPAAQVPCLAESVEIDDTVWTFKLREDVRFHDGTPFNADAVDFQFNRTLNPDFEYFSTVANAGTAWRLTWVESWRVIDEYTFEITTDEFRPNLSEELGFLLIPSPTAVMEWGNEDYPSHATGTGPFRMTDYDVGTGIIRMERNEDYWGGLDGRLAELDVLEFHSIGEPSARLAALQTGAIDLAFLPPPDSVDQLVAEGYQIFLKPYPHQMNVFFDLRDDGPLTDVRVRKAINYAVDRDGIVAVLNGLAAPAGQWVVPDSPWYLDDWEGYTYQPELAQQLLEEAGYAPGDLSFTMVSPTGGSGNMWPQLMNERIQQDLAAVGIELEIVYLEPGPAGQLLVPGSGAPQSADYDMLTWSLSHTSVLESGHFRTAAGDGAGCCNWGGYSNPEVDELYDQATQLFPGEEQDALMREYFRIALEEDAAWMVTVHDLNFRAATPEVHGFQNQISWFVDFTKVWVGEE